MFRFSQPKSLGWVVGDGSVCLASGGTAPRKAAQVAQPNIARQQSISCTRRLPFRKQAPSRQRKPYKPYKQRFTHQVKGAQAHQTEQNYLMRV